MKQILSFIVLLMALCICCVSCSSAISEDEVSKVIGTNKLPTDWYHASYAYDATDMKSVVGYSDYVIVAKVTDYVKTTYSPSGMPLTEYTVQVVENIKGKLDTTEEISIIKEGGLNEDRNTFVIYENDILPQVGKFYIFCIYVQSMGVNRVCGASCTIAIANGNNYAGEAKYIEICDSYANEIVAERVRHKSQNDAG